MESSSGEEVFKKIQTTVEKLKTKYPNVKVIASEVTPRLDEFDTQVKDCNKLLNDYVSESNNVYIARHSNLRDPTFFLADKKHLQKRAAGRFASNIKWALRRAYGITRTFQGSRDNSNGYNDNRAGGYSNDYNDNRAGRYSNDHNENRASQYSNGYTDNRSSHMSNPQRLWGYVPMPKGDELVDLLKKFYHG